MHIINCCIAERLSSNILPILASSFSVLGNTGEAFAMSRCGKEVK
jgi:hypothetical protein